jgi:hypothetical protein
MNRRGFLASLPFLPAAAKAALAPAPELYRCVITPNVKTYQLLSVPWYQMKRVSAFYTLEYEDKLDEIFEKDPIVRRRNFSARRVVRFRESLARQLAMPAPNLP